MKLMMNIDAQKSEKPKIERKFEFESVNTEKSAMLQKNCAAKNIIMGNEKLFWTQNWVLYKTEVVFLEEEQYLYKFQANLIKE